MIKKILLVLFMLCLAQSAFAAKTVNIFAYSREVPQTPIYNQYGQSFKLSDFKGDFLIVVFWSRTCIPCLREMKDLNGFVNKTAGNGIKVILVSPAEDWKIENEQKTFLQRYGGKDLEYYVDRNNLLATDFGIFTSPHSVLVNDKSLEIGRIRGALDWDSDDVIEYIYKLKARY